MNVLAGGNEVKSYHYQMNEVLKPKRMKLSQPGAFGCLSYFNFHEIVFFRVCGQIIATTSYYSQAFCVL